MVEERRTQLPRWLKGILWTGLILIVAYVGIYGFTWGKLLLAEKALRAAGRPMSLAEIERPEVADEENAARLVRRTNRALAGYLLPPFMEGGGEYVYTWGLHPGVWRRVSPGGPFGAPEDDDLLNFVQRPEVAALLLDLKSAAKRRYFRFPPDMSVNDLYDYLEELGLITKFLTDLSVDQARAGKSAEAWESVRLALYLAKNAPEIRVIADMEPSRDLLSARCLLAIEKLAEIYPPSEMTMERLLPELEGIEDNTAYLESLDVYRIGGTQVTSKDLLRHADLSPWMAAIYRFAPPVRMLDRAEYYESSLKLYVDSSTLPYLRPDYSNAKRYDPPQLYLRSGLLRYMESPTGFSAHIGIAQTRITRAGLAVLCYREAHGHFPSELAKLELDRLEDPFSGTTLKYRKEGDGFVVYSVGYNQEDDMGGYQDIVWRYPSESTTVMEEGTSNP